MTVNSRLKHEATLWVALCRATWRADAEVAADRREALAYRNGLLDAWCIVTEEDMDAVGEKLQEAMEAMAEGLAQSV